MGVECMRIYDYTDIVNAVEDLRKIELEYVAEYEKKNPNDCTRRRMAENYITALNDVLRAFK